LGLGPEFRAVAVILTGHGRSTAMKFTAVFEKVPQGYIAFVEELPGANTQGATLEEARENLQEAVELVLEANRTLAEEMMKGKSVIREEFPLQAA
jgi:predicted RNase H-like HicB family nuclease